MKLPSKVLSFFTFLFLSFLLTFSTGANSQSIIERSFDLGKIKKNNEDIVDLVIYNPAPTAMNLINHFATPPMQVQIRDRVLLAGGFTFVRVKINQMQIGPFDKTLELHFDQAEYDIKIQFTGKVQRLPSNGLQKCPSFDDVPTPRQIAKRRRKVTGQIRSFNVMLGEEPEKIELLSEEFRPNNMVFLIDISSSMAKEGKLELLKESLITLLQPLREEDILSIVCYDNEAKLIENAKAVDKEKIEGIIQSLEAKGRTNAIEGIELAIQTALNNYLNEGNNQLYLVSDGAFDLKPGPNGTKRQIENAAKEGLKVSVLAIKSKSWARKELKKLSKLGNGDMVRIDQLKDRDQILKNIKKNSRL